MFTLKKCSDLAYAHIQRDLVIAATGFHCGIMPHPETSTERDVKQSENRLILANVKQFCIIYGKLQPKIRAA